MCPICATLAVVRKTKPEVIEHLAVAARELIAAATLMLEEAGSAIDAAHPRAPEEDVDGAATGKVRRIDVG